MQNQVAGSMKLCLPQHILQPQYTSQVNETIGLKSFAEHATNKHDNGVANGIYIVFDSYVNLNIQYIT